MSTKNEKNTAAEATIQNKPLQVRQERILRRRVDEHFRKLKDAVAQQLDEQFALTPRQAAIVKKAVARHHRLTQQITVNITNAEAELAETGVAIQSYGYANESWGSLGRDITGGATNFSKVTEKEAVRLTVQRALGTRPGPKESANHKIRELHADAHRKIDDAVLGGSDALDFLDALPSVAEILKGLDK